MFDPETYTHKNLIEKQWPWTYKVREHHYFCCWAHGDHCYLEYYHFEKEQANANKKVFLGNYGSFDKCVEAAEFIVGLMNE